MSAHLLLVTLGPVQEFIAQARRMRDLWYGSHLLSELSRAAARKLVSAGAELIVPALDRGDPELEPCLAPVREHTKRPPKSIANKLLAAIPDGICPQQLAKDTRQTVMDFWRSEVALPVKNICKPLLAENIDAVWNEQIESLLEFSASWLPLDDYVETRRKLEQAVAARKLLRDFAPWTQGRGNAYKSSLDGARASVLKPTDRDAKLIRKYRIPDGEHLDAVSMIKRAGGEPEQFVPLPNIAFAAWLERASVVASEKLKRLGDACKEKEFSQVQRTDLPCARAFGFEASVLLPSRWRSIFEDHGLNKEDAVKWGKQFVEPLFKKLDEPYPYVACLVADGDHMGGAIDALTSAESHKAFSRSLSAFAIEAREIVEQRHLGVLVYAGGDDVLAFVSLPKALDCVNELRTAFERAMSSIPDKKKRPTLSVGLGIGHFMERMGDLLELGRQAEREAKRDRNALAVIVDKRSGGARRWREQWKSEQEHECDPVRQLKKAIDLLRDNISSRKIYEIAKLLQQLPKPGMAKHDHWSRVLVLEVKRSLERNENGPLRPHDVGLELDSTKTSKSYETLHQEVEAWVERMLIARTFERAAIRERRSQEAVA